VIYDLELKELPIFVNPMLGDSKYRSVFGGEGFLPEGSFITSDCFILCRASVPTIIRASSFWA
jgi:6-phosphofructokinase 1